MTEKPATLASALAAFQAAIPHIGKGNLAVMKSDKGSYKYTYADLSDISSKVLPLLAAQGLSFSAKPTINGDGKFVLEYTLRHSSGESDMGQYPLSATGTPQQVGSAITYARRYALCAVTGVTPDEDDDGYAASQAPAIGSGQPPQQRQETARAEQPAQAPVQTPAQRAAAAVGVILEAPTADAVETARKRVQKAPADVQAVDVSGLVPASRRDALGIRSGEAVTLSQLADLKLDLLLETLAENKKLVEASA